MQWCEFATRASEILHVTMVLYSLQSHNRHVRGLSKRARSIWNREQANI